MVKYFITHNRHIQETSTREPESWVYMVNPTEAERLSICEELEIDKDDLIAALDTDEKSRVSVEDTYTLIIVDIPVMEVRHGKNEFMTIPLGIIQTSECVITVCSQQTNLLIRFIEDKVRDFTTKKQMRFIYQILYSNCVEFQKNLYIIDKRRMEIENRIYKDTEDADLIALHELESNLVYFSTSLRANGAVLNRLTRYGNIKKYPEDEELMDDIIIENKQAVEMTEVYQNIIDGTRELLSTIINNRMNNIMKYLAAITIVMAIPTIISGVYGMNLAAEGMPLSQNPYGFGIICGLILIICIVTLLILKKKKML